MNRIGEANFQPPTFEEPNEKPRILIVDDNRDFTYSAKLALERTGRYSVWEENEPARAHQTAQRVKPDLILLDIAMPETDGGEVAARIESDPTMHRTPIIFLTALVTKAETRSGLQIQGHIHFSPNRSAFQNWSQASNDICLRTQCCDGERPQRSLRQIDGDRWIPRRGIEKFS